MLCEWLASVIVPNGYSSNFKRLVSMKDLRLIGMKTHDCHILMQQLLPLALRGVLTKDVRFTITKLCSFFNSICSKCPSHISQSAEPVLHSIASEIAGRLLTYSIDVRRELSLSKRSCTYLSRYVLRSAASPLGTAAGFLLLVEGHR
ncbi:hypothetical protein TIFTF001_042671 [Ficus carica]|uniref:Uncharacterized protein n=1 Tax=Ficus carica TaxID=3494 RepID=A0AA88D1G2_FICCA|nr:hypothetical protein TIFTF001_042671 [Ficus carica]